MVGVLLSLPAAPPSDHAADALAAAICHAGYAAGDRTAEAVPV
jgi:Holliday junction resolvasome RuvABC endonuclease subunit